MDEVTLPTGEKLPGYDDESPVDAHVLRKWLGEHCPDRWGKGSLGGGEQIFEPPAELREGMRDALPMYERQIITDVIGALQVVGRATIVENATYRALVRDRRELERLSAGLIRLGLAHRLMEADGDPVTAALDALAIAADAAVSAANLLDTIEAAKAAKPTD